MHNYTFHLSDGSSKTVTTEQHHTEHSDIPSWFKAHEESLKKFAITAATIAIIKHGNVVIWKKP
jgi:hypothetical protein